MELTKQETGNVKASNEEEVEEVEETSTKTEKKEEEIEPSSFRESLILEDAHSGRKICLFSDSQSIGNLCSLSIWLRDNYFENNKKKTKPYIN